LGFELTLTSLLFFLVTIFRVEYLIKRIIVCVWLVYGIVWSFVIDGVEADGANHHILKIVYRLLSFNGEILTQSEPLTSSG